MVTVHQATQTLETLYFDEFKAAYLDKTEVPGTLLDLHKYFKYQTRIYTFSSVQRISQLYDDLRAGRISETGLNVDGKLVSYPLMFLTEMAQRLLSHLRTECMVDGEYPLSTTSILEKLAGELSTLLTMHGYEQETISDEYYQSCIEASVWKTCIINNPWLMVAILIRFTGYQLIENLYAYTLTGSEIVEAINK